MRRLLLIIITLVVTLFGQDVFCQQQPPLSGDNELFSSELIELMGRNLTDEQNLQITEFIAQWDSSMFSPPEMQAIINSFNQLISRNARPAPHLVNYIELLACFIEHDAARRHYPVWETAFEDILTSNSQSLQSINELFLSTTRLISENILVSTGAVTWKSSKPDYTFVFEDSLRVVFGEFDLEGFNHIDTLSIFGTSGSLYPLSRVWVGKGGKVTWERAGLDADEAYARLNEYTIDLTRSEYHADSASFNFNRYFQMPVSGLLTDRLMSTKNQDEANYPGFASYMQEFSIKGIFRNVDYSGGLSMQGSRLIGSGGELDNASLIFFRDGEKFLKAESKHFVFRPQGTSSVSTTVVIYLENDSVFHPDLHLNYVESTRELSLNQNQKVISQSPWDNQFHKVDMSFARLIWQIDDNSMQLTMPRAGSVGNASFESLNFFDRNRYQQLQGMDTGHPLFSLKKYSEVCGSEIFTAEDYSRFMRRPASGIRHQLLELTLQGFIFFDTDTDLIQIRQRLYDYLQANIRRIDYDVINFTSTTDAPQENALIDLTTFDMKINGIPRVFISNSQNVNIFPSGNTVTLKQNRNFRFDGVINAGNLSFFGDNFAFNYDDFTINLQNVDSISLRASKDEKDLYGRAMLDNVKNLIRNVTGDLQVDRPDNKSSRVNYPGYPKFSSRENSYVFFEKPYIQNNVYRSDDFYYELYPFEMDSLNNFRNEELRFRGRLVTTGIFPDIEEWLVLQEDFSLGIRHQIPEAGIPAYDGKALYHNYVAMSNEGLRGSGKFDYLTSVSYSEDFLFMPDSMQAVAHDFVMARQKTGTEFPSVKSANNIIEWLPDDDLMTVDQTDTDFTMFDEQIELKGSLNIRPSGLTGGGLISLKNAGINSDNHIFGSGSFNSENSSFVLNDAEKTGITLSAGNLHSFIDIEQGEGEFSPNTRPSMVSLPANEYLGHPESFSWNMNNMEFEFLSAEIHDSGLKGAEYISTRNGQDSLRFISPHMLMDYGTGLLTANQVISVNVADAIVYPGDETLLIGREAKMMPLKEARIIASAGESSHEIYNATVQVEGRNNYSGSGEYDYIDESGEVQSIHFETISIDDDIRTIATGIIPESDSFMLSPHFSFSGEASLLSSRKNLNFSGAAKISGECDGLIGNWLSFENVIDPMEVLIPVPVQPLSPENERIYSGIFVANDSIHVYPAFFSERNNYADQPIVSANGYMKYDPSAGEYRIASLEKLRDMDLPGNYLSLNTNECLLSGGGQMDLGISLGQLELSAVGSATNKVNENETTLEATLSMDFFFAEEALALLVQRADSLGGKSLDSLSYFFSGGLSEILGRERALNFNFPGENDESAEPLPEELAKTVILSDVKLKWNKISRSYQSVGEIGIAFIGGQPVNKSYTGYLEITKRRSGDFLDFYIELEKDNWFYFGYTRGVMQAFSSDPEFTGIIENLALRHRRKKVSGNEIRYVYMVASDTKLEQFFKTYNNYSQGIENEPVPDEPLTEEEPQTGDLRKETD